MPHRILELTPHEQRYFATCFSVEGHGDHEARVAKMDEIYANLRQGKSYRLALAANSHIFPDIAKCYKEGIIGPEGSVRKYFEGLAANSHNARLFKSLLTSGNPKMASEHLEDLLHHADSCSVRVVRLRDGSLRSFRGAGEASVDTEMFGIDSDYAFVHGIKSGKAIAVADATKTDFTSHSKWFSNHLVCDVAQYIARLQGSPFPTRKKASEKES